MSIKLAFLSIFLSLALCHSDQKEDSFYLIKQDGSLLAKLKIPYDFRFKNSTHITQGQSISLLTFYPGFRSPDDPTEKPYGEGCLGYCDGRFLLSLDSKNVPEGEISSDLVASTYLNERRMVSALPNAHYREIKPENSFDISFEITTNDKVSGVSIADRLYLLKRSKTKPHSYEISANCILNTVRQSCELYTASSCVPGLLIGLHAVDISRMSEFVEMASASNRFVSGLMTYPACTK